VRGAINGSVLVLLIWVLDVMLGPSMGLGTSVPTRFLPTRFVTLWAANRPSGHSGRLGDLGISATWTAGAVVVAFAVVAATARIGRQRHRLRPGSTMDQL
jgi:hypothetical protein